MKRKEDKDRPFLLKIFDRSTIIGILTSVLLTMLMVVILILLNDPSSILKIPWYFWLIFLAGGMVFGIIVVFFIIGLTHIFICIPMRRKIRKEKQKIEEKQTKSKKS